MAEFHYKIERVVLEKNFSQLLKSKSFKHIKTIDISEGTENFNPFNVDKVAKMLKNKEIKTIIQDFYVEKYAGMTDGADKSLAEKNDYNVRLIMSQLLKELYYKEINERLERIETVLYSILGKDLSQNQNLEFVFSDALVSEFKTVLKEVE